MASARWLLAASALPIVALAVWFGVVDPSRVGEGRCASCGLEGWVIAAHVVAAVWLGGVVALASALRRGAPGPGRVTVAALVAAGLFLIASLVWRALFTPLATVALFASILLLPAAAIWWLIATITWRRPPATGEERTRRLGMALAGAWVSLALLLPAVYAWVWADRVEWLVF